MGVTWHRNEDPLPLDSPRLQVFESVTDRGTASELHVQGAERSDNGLFSCLAKNGFGTDRRSIKLVVLEVPSAPFDVKVEQSWSRSASVRWNAPYSGNSPVSKYIVQYWKDHGAAHRLEEAIVVAPQTSTLLRELQPGTSYIVRVLAENTVGRGSPSESQKFQTKEEEPSGAPTDVAAESRGPTLLRIKWKAPPKEQWNGHLLGYYIGYRSRASEEPYSYQSMLVTDQPEEEHLLSGLKRATEYSIVVKAYNAAGSGPDSQEVFARTADSEPPLPPRLWLESHDRFFIVVHWQQPPGPPVTHYIMSYREENGPWRELTVPQADNSKYTFETITVLTEGGALSDASMPAPHGSQSRELPVYFRLSVVAPAAASLTIIVLVIAGACLFVSHERRKYKNIIVPPMKPVKSGTYMSGAASLGRNVPVPGNSGQGRPGKQQHHRGGGRDPPLRHRSLEAVTGGDLSAIELCVEDWKQKQQHQGWKGQATRMATAQDSGKQGGGVQSDGTSASSTSNGDGAKGASDSVVETPNGLELNSSAYKPDADPSSSQANNMAVAFELNL
ncbi:hypothetical protein MTO96_049577 [Rhipicephalus appendiculatus]